MRWGRSCPTSFSVILTALLVLSSGCRMAQSTGPAAASPATIDAPGQQSEPGEQLTPRQQAALDQVRQITDALGSGAPGPAPGSAAAVPSVLWIDSRHPSAGGRRPGTANSRLTPADSSINLETPGAALSAATIHDPPAAALQQASYKTPEPEPKRDERQEIDRAALTDALLRQIRDSGDPDLVKAVNAAALSLLAADRTPPADLLKPLGSQQRRLVQQYQRMLIAVADQIAAGGNKIDTSAIVKQLESLMGDKALLIRRVELCRRVDGYGVYDPFPSNKFVIRRDRRMIVYVELDNFKTVCTDNGRHEVRLAQEMALYNDADGLEVWRLRQETIRDTSRNQRNDFYTVKMIQMPQWLGVGKYRLKVRLTDLNGSTEAETVVEIQFVADETLVSGKR